MTMTLQDKLETELYMVTSKFKDKGLDCQSIQSALIERSYFIHLDIKFEDKGTNNDT